MRPQESYDRAIQMTQWLLSRGLTLDGKDEPADWSTWMDSWDPNAWKEKTDG